MKKLLLVLSLILSASHVYALPAISAPNKGAELEQVVKVVDSKTELSLTQKILKPIKVQVLKWNMFINREIPKYMKTLKHNPSWLAIISALFAAFVYGILHTLGPGHGKMVVGTYFLTQEANFLQGVWLGFKTAFAHVGGAVLLVLTTDIALRSVVMNPDQHMYLLKNISFSLIIFVGFVMFTQAILHATGKVKNTGCSHCNHSHGHHHSHGHNHTHSHEYNKKDTFIALAIGCIPCTGSLLILLYAMANNILFLGLSMVVFVALGMAVTMIILGVVTILGKKKLVDKLFTSNKHAHKSKIVLETSGAVFIMLVGLLLLWVNL